MGMGNDNFPKFEGEFSGWTWNFPKYPKQVRFKDGKRLSLEVSVQHVNKLIMEWLNLTENPNPDIYIHIKYKNYIYVSYTLLDNKD